MSADLSERGRTASADGPFDGMTTPARIKARVVMPGSEPCIHGYALEDDLALHYGFTDTLYLTLTAELPSAETARAFEVALLFLAPVAIDEAPTHAASLARLCAAPASAVLAVGAVGLAERARYTLEGHRDFLTWLAHPVGAPPDVSLSAEACDRESVARLRAALPAALSVPALEQPLTRAAAVLAVLFACGLRRSEQIQAAWTFAGMASCFAEAIATPQTSFEQYPMNLPAFRYEVTP